MTELYTVTDENFETVARRVSLAEAAEIVGAPLAWVRLQIQRNGCACIGIFDIDPAHKAAHYAGR